MADTTSDYDREKLQERLAKISGGVAVIRVGAATEAEMKEKKAVFEDALHATRANVEEGNCSWRWCCTIHCTKIRSALREKYWVKKCLVLILFRAEETTSSNCC